MAGPFFSRVQLLVGFCAVVVMLSLGLSAWTFVRQSQADTIRAADKKAQNLTKVSQCFQQVENAPKVLRILGLVDILATNSIKANKQALAVSPKNDPLRSTREQSLVRLVPARNNLRKFISQTTNQAPKKASCDRLAAQLHIDPSKISR